MSALSEWVLTIEGTQSGHRVALILAMVAAFLHAVVGAMQKGRYDPWVTRGAIDVNLFLISLPFALFVVPWPEGNLWWLLLGAVVIHFFYKVGQAMAYERGAYTVVYPVVRGTGPLFTVLAGYLIFGEVFSATQWFGILLLVGSILGLAAYNLAAIEVDRDTLVPALWLAFATGLIVAIYTTYDAYGIRASPDPFVFLVWFFLVTSIDMPCIAFVRLRRMAAPPDLWPLFKFGFWGALVALGSFGSIMLATRLDKVGEAAVLRETSTVFAALIGWIVLRETVGPRRLLLMALIAGGAVIVEFGG